MKKGFVFIETLLVLAILAFGLVNLCSMYIKISSDINIKKYYDNVSDLYKVDVIRSLLTNKNVTGDMSSFNSANCTTYMGSNCTTLLSDMSASNVYLINDVETVMTSQNENIKNSMREYLKTINEAQTHKTIIVEFNYNNRAYYASLYI